MSSYTPISCHVHDELETIATKRQLCHIHYHTPDTGQACLVDYIQDFQIYDKAEFMHTSTGQRIRLDHIQHIEVLFWR